MSHALSVRGAYREVARVGDETAVAGQHLQAAADALATALLTLGTAAGDDRLDEMQRLEQARGFLVEAVTALSRARLFDPRVRTHALPFLLASEASTAAELARLHQIATRLLWQNHAYLPARAQATPLAPDEEAQLAVVFQGLARHARLGRALRRPWVLAALTAAVAGPMLGAPLVVAAAACVAVGIGVVGTAQRRR